MTRDRRLYHGFRGLAVALAVGGVLVAACTRDDAASLDDLSFVEVLVGGTDAARPLPLLIGVHGLGDTPEAFARYFLGEMSVPARLVFPRGPDVHGDGYSWFPLPRGGDGDETVSGIARSGRRLARLAARLTRERDVLGKPVIFGFSQGGILSFAVAASAGKQFAAAVPIAGFLPDVLIPGNIRGAPGVFAYHGADDPLIPASDGLRTVERFREAGVNASFFEYPGIAHGISRRMGEDIIAQLEGLADAESRAAAVR